MSRTSKARLALASEKPDTCTGPPRLFSPQGAKQKAQMSKPNTSYDPALLLQECLTIKQIINFARGATDWPPSDPFWRGIQADLKDACQRGNLSYSQRPLDQRRQWYYIRLDDLWPFLLSKDQRWQPLRDFCRQQWADARGDILPLDRDSKIRDLASSIRGDAGLKGIPLAQEVLNKAPDLCKDMRTSKSLSSTTVDHIIRRYGQYDDREENRKTTAK